MPRRFDLHNFREDKESEDIRVQPSSEQSVAMVSQLQREMGFQIQDPPSPTRVLH